MRIYLTSDEVHALAEEVRESLSSEATSINNNKVVQLSSSISKYLNSLTSLEQEIYQSTALMRSSALQKMKTAQLEYQTKKNNGEEITKEVRKSIYSDYGKARAELTTYLKNKQYLDKLSAHFKSGYSIVHSIRKYITDQDILYHVAVEGGGKSSSMIYQVSEENLLKNLELDTYRFSEALIMGEKEILDFNMRYRGTKTRGREAGNIILQDNLQKSLPNGEGSTLWSKGYRVFQTVREWVKSNPVEGRGYGVNFGHFLEAYYAMGGNKSNHTPEGFSSLKFFEYMISLQNSVEFYKGGDFENIQLKSNNATLTNIKTIRIVLQDILSILQNNKVTYKDDLKRLLSYEKIESQINNTELKVPQDLIDAINALGN